MQELQEQQLDGALPDPTQGQYSPAWVKSGANLIKLQSDTFNSIAIGNKPMTYLKEAIGSWKSQGGDAARKEYQAALQKCK